MAGRCSAALVEPPVAATTAAAFSRPVRVTRSRGSGPPASNAAMTAWPARRAMPCRSEKTAGIIDEPSGARPSASDTMPIVFAVNWPGQAPMVGAQTSSSSLTSCSGIVPTRTPPTPS